MPASFTKRKLEVFSIHALKSNGQVDYKSLFKDFAEINDERRSVIVNEKLIAVPTVEVKGTTVLLVAYEGNVGQNPLIFNATNAEERTERLKRGEIVATRTHAVVDIESREVIVEYNHAGAKAGDLASVITNSLSESETWRGLNVELNPVADEEFVKAIEKFRRIRLASLRVARPNPGWTDHVNNLTEMAGESDAKDVEVALSANRGCPCPWLLELLNTSSNWLTDNIPFLRGRGLLGIVRARLARPLSR
jgi:hypothetical protein